MIHVTSWYTRKVLECWLICCLLLQHLTNQIPPVSPSKHPTFKNNLLESPFSNGLTNAHAALTIYSSNQALTLPRVTEVLSGRKEVLVTQEPDGNIIMTPLNGIIKQDSQITGSEQTDTLKTSDVVYQPAPSPQIIQTLSTSPSSTLSSPVKPQNLTKHECETKINQIGNGYGKFTH